jgi:hypothetical protein
VQQENDKKSNKCCVYVPGLPHLSDPILRELSRIIDCDLIVTRFPDFGGAFHEVGLHNTHKLDISAHIDFEYLEFLSPGTIFRELKWFITGQKRRYIKVLRNGLLRQLETLDPSVIYATSDQNLFIYLLIGSKFESRIVIIQPALITFRRKGLKDAFIFGGMKVLNRLDSVRSRPEEINWGQTLCDGAAFVWSELELVSKIKSKTYISGNLFMEELNLDSFKESNNQLLIVAPNLSVEDIVIRENYLNNIKRICIEFPTLEIIYRSHPSDSYDIDLESIPNLKESRSLDSNGMIPKAIISGTSALVVQLRLFVSNITIFDQGKFAKYGGPYFSEHYFNITNNVENVLDWLTNVYSYDERTYDQDLPKQQKIESKEIFMYLFTPSSDLRKAASKFCLRI